MSTKLENDELVVWPGQTKRAKLCYLFTVIDIFSKYTMLMPTSRKTDDETQLAMENEVSRTKALGFKVYEVQKDRGNEFKVA